MTDVVDDALAAVTPAMRASLEAVEDHYVAKIADLTHQNATLSAERDEALSRLAGETQRADAAEAWRTSHMQEYQPAGHAVKPDDPPPPAVCPPGTDRAGQTIPAGETEAWCDVVEPPLPDWFFPEHNVDLIQQQYVTNLTQYRQQVEAAVGGLPGLIDGLGPRIPHNDLATSLARLDQWKDIADDSGLELHPRFMFGGYLSDARKAAMASAFKFTGEGQVMAGVSIPRPTNGQSTSFNTVFEDEYRRFYREVFAWAVANGVKMINLCWYGMAYSEVYYGPALQNDPAGWLAGHKRLVDIIAAEQPKGVTVGWGLSGHGPFFNAPNMPAGSKDMGMALAQYMKSKMPEKDRVEGQGNGWGANGVWGQSSEATENQMDHYFDTGIIPGVQAVQPWAQGTYSQYTAAQAQAAVANAKRVRARHMEFYLYTLAATSRNVWREPIEEFRSA